MITITVLMDDSPGVPGTVSEHGLSFLVEHGGRSVLFDTGKTGAFLDNARTLGLDPGAASAVVVSHSHYDHGGGLRRFYDETSSRADLWTGPAFFHKKWSDEQPAARFLGIDVDAAFLKAIGVRHQELPEGSDQAADIAPGMRVICGFPRAHACERPNARFVVDRPEGRRPDDFRDEVCLSVATKEGPVLLVGCSHPGVMNMMDTAERVLGQALRAVLGGSHLVEAGPERLDETIEYLKDKRLAMAALGHCTGHLATAALSERMPSFKPLYPGARFSLP